MGWLAKAILVLRVAACDKMDSQIVEEFRKYEFLYNKEMPEYLDRERARRAYEEIGMTRGVDWPCQ